MSGTRIPVDIPLLRDLYSPDFDPAKSLLNDTAGVNTQTAEDIEKKVSEAEQKLFSGEAPGPLSAQEAAAIEAQTDQLRDAIAGTRQRISNIKARINKQAAPEGQPELGFSVDLDKKPRLRRAIKKAFGIRPKALTYSMYMTALRAKRELEEEESKAYANGNWEG